MPLLTWTVRTDEIGVAPHAGRPDDFEGFGP